MVGASARIVRRLAKAAGIDKRITPHSLRHNFITAALDRHANYIVSPFVDVRHP